ncbi:MAG: aminopeptidase N [Marinosulfonomonas sp.]
MQDATPQTIYLSDYKPFTHTIDSVELTFKLAANATRVVSRINFTPNPASDGGDFFLHGEKLTLISASIDGTPISDIGHELTETGITIPAANLPKDGFVWTAEVEIDPAANTALEGLYMSNGMYCTQCEAEGFRKITYYPDRPDVMAVFTVRIEGDAPVLLSNGNPVNDGQGWAEWHDPWPKPAYLFALVAGDLVAHSAEFTTASANLVALNIYVRPGDETKCDYAMDALIRSMKWDEDVYGREYDLDVFNIVAVDDFNMGAMENKGLNVFNSKYVLASPETATDTDYERIEGIIAHEYFHNWTGNRITCRDWFQLCLKEGLTVFRDQQFSGDMRSHAVKRIEDVLQLRARQFREDNGPLSHPVRPESFVEINNFYTATVYEKGAEVIGMLKTLVGDEGYSNALDAYFERHDGDAATIEDWLQVFEDTTGRDLSQFKRWYSQSGTPRLNVTDDFRDGTYTLHIEQETPATPGQDNKDPFVIPVAVGLLNPNGDEVVPTTVLELTQARQSFAFDGLSNAPTPSLLRGFSAPVILNRDTSEAERTLLLAHDTDPFNKWEAGRALAKGVLTRMITEDAKADPAFLDALSHVVLNPDLDPAFRALTLAMPGEDDMAQTLFEAGHVPDPAKIYSTRQDLLTTLAQHLGDRLSQLYSEMAVNGAYTPDAAAAGKRALRGAALGLINRLDGGEAAKQQFDTADNMTEQVAALSCLVPTEYGPAALASFYNQWKADRLVIDKWFMVQPSRAKPENALKVTQDLQDHPDFNWKNPNRLRALLFGLVATSPAAFHQADGATYRFFADWIIKLDPVNPQVAARSVTYFETWRRYDADRQAMIREALTRIKSTANLSRDTDEMVTRILGD